MLDWPHGGRLSPRLLKSPLLPIISLFYLRPAVKTRVKRAGGGGVSSSGREWEENQRTVFEGGQTRALNWRRAR